VLIKKAAGTIWLRFFGMGMEKKRGVQHIRAFFKIISGMS
jgi:hypothetical protein